MENETDNGLAIEYVQSGRNGRVTLTARLGTEAPYVHKLDVTLPKARAEFLDALANR